MINKGSRGKCTAHFRDSFSILPKTQKFPAALSAAGNMHIFKELAPPLRRGNQVSQN